MLRAIHSCLISGFLLMFCPFVCSSQILFNQIGYYVNGSKEAAVIDNSGRLTHFRLISEDDVVQYEGTVGALVQSKNSFNKARLLIFSDFTTRGVYRLQAGYKSGNTFMLRFTSEPFIIGEGVLHDVSKAVLKNFYYQRASTPILLQYAGIWSRTAAHPDNVVYVHSSAATLERPAETLISTPGGWYDAGDFNKYVPSSAITMAALLSAYEDFPDYWQTISLNIPESGNGISDILSEVAYNLRWLLTMQDEDGGVYHKTTSQSFTKLIMPTQDNSTRWVVKKNTAATLDFAAITAQAYRVYKQFPQTSNLADSCIRASTAAWNWAANNPEVYYSEYDQKNLFNPAITTGAYDDGVKVCIRKDNTGNCIEWEYKWENINDEWYWAACELYLSAGLSGLDHSQYRDAIYKYLRPYKLFTPQYSHVQMLGHYSLLRLKEEEFAEPVRREIIGYANYLVNCISENAYGVLIGRKAEDFMWGSNFIAAGQSITLLNAYKLTKDERFLKGALSNVDYLLGKNPTGYCFVTGFGSKSPKRPFHPISTADGITEPVPGMIVGGPYGGVVTVEKVSSRYFPFADPLTDPELLYSDNDSIAAVNENCIHTNASVNYIFNAFEYYMKLNIVDKALSRDTSE